jgi:four helix bundle protein
MKNNILYGKADKLAHLVYKSTRDFPVHERYGLTSIRRAALSVPLNIVEGFARKGSKQYKQFLLIAYGSLKETKYLIDFSRDEDYINDLVHKELFELSEECAKLLWATIRSIEKKDLDAHS